MKITLSGTQRKQADRVGGIELMIPWTATHLPAPVGAPRDATNDEKLYAKAMLRDEQTEHALIPVRVRVVEASHTTYDGPHLAVILIGRRWVHAEGRPVSKRTWAKV